MKEVIFRAARRLDLSVVLVANQPMSIPPGNPRVALVVVRSGANMADKYIVTSAQPGDIAITADVPLAAELVTKGVQVINPRGEEYTEATMPSVLAARNLFDAARGAGMEIPGPQPYSDKDRQTFANSLDRVLTRGSANRKGSDLQ